MKQIEKDQDAVSPLIRLEGVAKRSAMGDSARDFQYLSQRLREIEKMIEAGETRDEALCEQFRGLELAVQALATRYAERQRESEEAILEVARSLREHFLEFHRLKSDLMGLAAHVDRWTRRVEKLFKTPPFRWFRRLRPRG